MIKNDIFCIFVNRWYRVESTVLFLATNAPIIKIEM